MGATEITVKEWSNYTQVIQSLTTRIGKPQAHLELEKLAVFYKQKQTVTTRQGVLLMLCNIKTPEEYRVFLKLQQILIDIYMIKAPIDFMGEGPYTFFYLVYLDSILGIELLWMVNRIYDCFSQHTVSIMKSLMMIGGTQVVCAPETDVQAKKEIQAFLIRKISLFLTQAECIFQRFKLTSEQRALCVPTKGDMHCNGSIPYFIYAFTPPVVYKPRDMRIDAYVNDALRGMNQILPTNLQLPVMDIALYEDNTGSMQIAVHADEMNGVIADQYFQKLGALLCFAKLFGIHDLHRENIMATLEGPVIIDLECAFNSAIIKQEKFDALSLYDMRGAFKRSVEENSTFFVNGKIPDLAEKGIADCILMGFALAADACKDHETELTSLYGEIIKKECMMRLTPVATQEYYDEMFNGNTHGQCKVSETVVGFCNKIKENLENIATVIEFDTELLGAIIYKDMHWGNIPLLRVIHQIQKPRFVLVDDRVFALIEGVDGTWVKEQCEEFKKQIMWLNTESAKTELKRSVITG